MMQHAIEMLVSQQKEEIAKAGSIAAASNLGGPGRSRLRGARGNAWALLNDISRSGYVWSDATLHRHPMLALAAGTVSGLAVDEAKRGGFESRARGTRAAGPLLDPDETRVKVAGHRDTALSEGTGRAARARRGGSGYR